MQEYYDIVIIGAGPAGLNAGLHAVKSGRKASILLVDKTAPWEHPIQCAEAVGRRGFEEAIDIKPHWIRRIVTGARFHSPGGVTATYTDATGGYIIDRAALQRDVAGELENLGVTCRFDCRVAHLSAMKNFRRIVEFADGSAVSSRVVIDASGPIALLGRESLPVKPPDLEPACFVLAEGLDLPPDIVHLYMSREFAPGGYAWAFPRGAGANIGIVIGSAFKGSVNLRSLLDGFLQQHFPGVSIVSRYAGTIPCTAGRLRMAVPGLLKAGDAASTVNPISRAGISEALLCGKFAGGYAAAMLGAENEGELRKIAGAYEAAWRKKRGARQEKLARVKSAFAEVPDEDYNRAAEALSRLGSDNLGMFQIFKAALGRFPRLLWGLRHMV
jgi:geranylgeranyl reductase family protein